MTTGEEPPETTKHWILQYPTLLSIKINWLNWNRNTNRPFLELPSLKHGTPTPLSEYLSFFQILYQIAWIRCPAQSVNLLDLVWSPVPELWRAQASQCYLRSASLGKLRRTTTKRQPQRERQQANGRVFDGCFHLDKKTETGMKRRTQTTSITVYSISSSSYSSAMPQIVVSIAHSSSSTSFFSSSCESNS